MAYILIYKLCFSLGFSLKKNRYNWFKTNVSRYPSDNGIKSFLNFVGGKYYIERSFHKKNIKIVWTKTELNFVPFPVLFLYCTFYKLKGTSSKDVTPLVEISTKKVLKKTDEEDDESHELLTDAYLGLQFQMPTMPFIKFMLISGKQYLFLSLLTIGTTNCYKIITTTTTQTLRYSSIDTS